MAPVQYLLQLQIRTLPYSKKEAVTLCKQALIVVMFRLLYQLQYVKETSPTAKTGK